MKIEDLVSPRETIVWRDWRDKPDQLFSWLIVSIPAYVMARLAIVGVVQWWGNGETSMLFVIVIPSVLILACMTSSAIWSYFHEAVDNPTIVTDRRILLASRAGDVTGIMLSDITSIRLVDGHDGLQLVIGRRNNADGTILRTGHLEEFAAAVAAATDHNAPGGVGSLRYFYAICRFIGFVAAYEFFMWMPEIVDALIETGLEPLTLGWSGLVVAPLALLIAGWMVWWSTMHLAAIVGFLLMPQYASAEQAGNWLPLETLHLLVPTFGWKGRLYGWLARLVYGPDLKTVGIGQA